MIALFDLSATFYTNINQPAHDSTPFRGKIVFLHGFCDHKNTYTHIWPRLQTLGYETTAFDQRGSGETSPGKLFGVTNERLVYQDLDRMIEEVTRGYSGDLFLAGLAMVRFPSVFSPKFHSANISLGRRYCSELSGKRAVSISYNRLRCILPSYQITCKFPHQFFSVNPPTQDLFKTISMWTISLSIERYLCFFFMATLTYHLAQNRPEPSS